MGGQGGQFSILVLADQLTFHECIHKGKRCLKPYPHQEGRFYQPSQLNFSHGYIPAEIVQPILQFANPVLGSFLRHCLLLVAHVYQHQFFGLAPHLQ